MTLLFITQKLHGQDAFGVLWIRAFMRRGYDVKVVCLEWRPDGIAKALGEKEEAEFDVHSLGKEKGYGKLHQALRFWKLITTLRYDRAFIHMSPVWYALGFWWWLFRRIPVYLWYTHYRMQIGVRLFRMFGKRFFCATSQSLPQLEGSPKKMVVGHGIDLAFWSKRENVCSDPRALLMVHRLSRSKRVELALEALHLLPEAYTLDVYGIEAEPDYVAELRALVRELHLDRRVRFHGMVPMKDLPALYGQHRLILNMASETIDKTMLEAMTCGCFPVTTRGNATAIGVSAAPRDDTPEAVAAFIERHTERLPLASDEMYRVIAERHGLDALVRKMDACIRAGT